MARSQTLTPKQAAFVEEYLVDLNGCHAAERAGYSKHTARRIAWQLLQRPPIQAALKVAMKAREDRTRITQDQVLRELAKIGFSDIRRAVAWGEGVACRDPDTDEVTIGNGVSLVGSGQIDDDTAAAISEISQTAQGLRIKMHDKQAALVSIGKHLGMFVERRDHTSSDGSMTPITVIVDGK